MLTQRCSTFQSTIPFRIIGDDGFPNEIEPDGPSAAWTLRQFVDGFVVPHYLAPRNRQPGTVCFYYQDVDLWEEFFPQNPTLAEIDGNQDICREFVARLSRRPGLRAKRIKPNTIRKLCTHLQKIFDLAGPRNLYGRRNRSAAALIADVPYLERPELVRSSPDRDFTLEEIGLWLGACRYARQTRNVRRCRPEAFCRNLILFVYNTALRIDTVMSAELDMIGRKRENWITIPPTIYKGRKWGGDFYLNRHARAALDAVRVPGEKRLFHWDNWPSSQTWLQKYHERILQRSGIAEERYFGNHFHGLRSALLTWLNEQNPMVAKIVGGHRTGDVQQNHYVNPRIVIDLLEQVPQPRPVEPERQGMLF